MSDTIKEWEPLKEGFSVYFGYQKTSEKVIVGVYVLLDGEYLDTKFKLLPLTDKDNQYTMTLEALKFTLNQVELEGYDNFRLYCSGEQVLKWYVAGDYPKRYKAYFDDLYKLEDAINEEYPDMEMDYVIIQSAQNKVKKYLKGKQKELGLATTHGTFGHRKKVTPNKVKKSTTENKLPFEKR